MSVDPEELQEEPLEPVAHVRMVYLGPVAPHWDIRSVSGDETLIDEFRQRAIARLQLLPPHDPQFRRNRERVNRDAERERFDLDWDLGYDEDVDATALGDKPPSDTVTLAADGTELSVGKEEGDAEASESATADAEESESATADASAATEEAGAPAESEDAGEEE